MASVETRQDLRGRHRQTATQVHAGRAGGLGAGWTASPKGERRLILIGVQHPGITSDPPPEWGSICETLPYFTWPLTDFHQHATNMPMGKFAEYTNSQLYRT